MFEKISRTIVTEDAVLLTLENGVQIHISTHHDYIHLSFSNIDCDHGIIATPFAHHNKFPSLELSNIFDIEFKPYRKP